MRILFISDLHYLPQHNGGTQSLMHELALELQKRGHQPVVLAPLHHHGLMGLRTRALMKMLDRRTIRDDVMGYPVYRRWDIFGQLDEVVRDIAPDAAVVMPRAAVPLAREFVRMGIPTTVYFQDVEFQQLGGDPGQLTGVTFAANSEFTASRYRDAYGLEATVIPPLIQPGRYRAARAPENVTLINPHPLKGGELALDIAQACPEISFSFVSCWVLSEQHQQALQARVRTLKNVTLRPTTTDMKSVYRRAKILLAPSRWDEAWGRVASEAHINGIPVVASNRGGLKESVGPGGVLLDPDGPLEPWIEAIQRLWSDDAYYEEKSQAALAYSTRRQINPEHLLDTLLGVVSGTLKPRAGPQANYAG